jgi:endonuclease/exonuclease/phosphatase family metal-dependent hydrolase
MSPWRASTISAWLTALILTAPTPAQPSPPDLSVITYNIRAGFGPASHEAAEVPARLQSIAALISSEEADVVLLQEVDCNTTRSGEIDEAATLADLSSMNVFFAPAIPLQGGSFGVALLANWDIESAEGHPLFNPDYSESHPEYPDYFSEQRVALVADLVSGERRLHVITTHLGLTPDQREQQILQIC